MAALSLFPRLPAASSEKPAALQPLRARRRCMYQMNPQTAEVSVARPTIGLRSTSTSPSSWLGLPSKLTLALRIMWGLFIWMLRIAKRFFVREVYDEQLPLKVKKVSHLPNMDPWGMSWVLWINTLMELP